MEQEQDCAAGKDCAKLVLQCAKSLCKPALIHASVWTTKDIQNFFLLFSLTLSHYMV